MEKIIEENFEQKKYKFVSFDLETTGLNTKKDEIIQIGIIEFGLDGKIKNQFCSYVKTEKNISDMVNYITGLDKEKIFSAPSFDQIKNQLDPYFSENTILIGHNINFDISILSRYMDIKSAGHIDTFLLSKSLLPFSKSYGLEALASQIGEKGKFHDALDDAILSKKLFLYLYEKIDILLKNYPILNNFFSKTESIIGKIFYLKNIKTSSLPTGEKNKKNISPNPQNHNITNEKKIDIMEAKFSQIIEFLPTNDIIYAFGSLQKQALAKKLLEKKNLYVKNMYQEAIFDKDNFEKFLEQENFEEFEVLFFLKYLQSIENGSYYMDINSASDFRIFQFLTSQKENLHENGITLTTHQNLYKLDLTGKKIIFFDENWWFQTYGKHISQDLDLNNILNEIEVIKYESKFSDPKIEKNIQILIDKFVIFMGICYLEIIPSFSGTSKNILEFSHLFEDINFWQTQKSFQNMGQFFDENNFGKYKEKIKNILDKIENYFGDIFLIEKKMIGENMNFAFKKNFPVSYINFLEKFEGSDTTFLGLNGKKLIASDQKNIEIEVFKTHENLQKNLNSGTIFVISLLLKNTKEIFNTLLRNRRKNIFAENITGGIGKNIASIKNLGKSDKIIIGSQEMLYGLLNEEVKIDRIILFSTGGALEQHILNDLRFYY